MRKEDKIKIETALDKKANEKLILARFSYGTNRCALYPSIAIEYNSWETILYQDVLDAENSDFKTIKTLKSFFPGIKIVFVYYNYLDGGTLLKTSLNRQAGRLYIMKGI